MERERALRIGLAVAALSFGSACAVGTTRLQIERSPFDVDVDRQRGEIAVRTFRDLRPEDRRPYVGAKRNNFGMVLGHVAAPEDRPLEDILTGYFVEALQRAGYRALREDEAGARSAGDFRPVAVLEGDIETFWLDMYMATWHNVVLAVRLRDLEGQVLWESRLRGDETNVLWSGASGEMEKVIRQALDKALAQAVAAFAADDFAERVRVAGEAGTP